MFRRVEARHFKCLKSIGVNLQPFNILIGPNASGKSTFLDVLGFLRDALQTNIEEAVRRRATTLDELVWRGENVAQGFELAVEVDVPAERQQANGYDLLRYEMGVGLGADGSLTITGENLWMVDSVRRKLIAGHQPALFPEVSDDRDPVVYPSRSKTPAGYRLIARKAESGNDYFRSERTDWNQMFRLLPNRPALSGVPQDQDRFPLALWFQQVLNESLQILQLNSVLMRRSCPANAPRAFQPDGSNLPFFVQELRQDAQRFDWWRGHLQTILPNLEDIHVKKKAEDNSLYLALTYRHSPVSVPAWLLSDGTLRLLALTLIAYLPQRDHVFLIEEPENGIHPHAVEAVFQSLSSVYDGQVLLATHSPLLLALAKPDDLVIFGQAADGATDVVRGLQHPALRSWQEEVSLDTLFAAGVLG